MQVKGIELRYTGKNSSNEEVLVVQPTDDGNQGGYFTSRAREEGKVWGQELWICGLGSAAIDSFKESQALNEDTEEFGIVYSSWPGHVAGRADKRLVLGTRRGEVLQRSFELRTNIIMEHGPTIEQESVEATIASAAETAELFDRMRSAQ